MTAITIRNVPEELRDELVARAARAGMSLEQYLLRALSVLATETRAEDYPIQDDVMAEIRANAEASGFHRTAEEIVADIHAMRGER